MRSWCVRTWKTDKGEELRIEAGSAEECRRLMRARVKHLHDWQEVEAKEDE